MDDITKKPAHRDWTNAFPAIAFIVVVALVAVVLLWK